MSIYTDYAKKYYRHKEALRREAARICIVSHTARNENGGFWQAHCIREEQCETHVLKRGAVLLGNTYTLRLPRFRMLLRWRYL